MAVSCAYCGSPNHVWWDCPKKPAGWKPKSLSEYTKTREQRSGSSGVEQTLDKRQVEGSIPSPTTPAPDNTVVFASHAIGYGPVIEFPTQADYDAAKKAAAEAASKKPRGRPATGFDKTAYQREYMRERRARLKLAKPNEDQK